MCLVKKPKVSTPASLPTNAEEAAQDIRIGQSGNGDPRNRKGGRSALRIGGRNRTNNP